VGKLSVHFGREWTLTFFKEVVIAEKNETSSEDPQEIIFRIQKVHKWKKITEKEKAVFSLFLRTSFKVPLDYAEHHKK